MFHIVIPTRHRWLGIVNYNCRLLDLVTELIKADPKIAIKIRLHNVFY